MCCETLWSKRYIDLTIPPIGCVLWDLVVWEMYWFVDSSRRLCCAILWSRRCIDTSLRLCAMRPCGRGDALRWVGCHVSFLIMRLVMFLRLWAMRPIIGQEDWSWEREWKVSPWLRGNVGNYGSYDRYFHLEKKLKNLNFIVASKIFKVGLNLVRLAGPLRGTHLTPSWRLYKGDYLSWLAHELVSCIFEPTKL